MFLAFFIYCFLYQTLCNSISVIKVRRSKAPSLNSVYEFTMKILQTSFYDISIFGGDNGIIHMHEWIRSLFFLG